MVDHAVDEGARELGATTASADKLVEGEIREAGVAPIGLPLINRDEFAPFEDETDARPVETDAYLAGVTLGGRSEKVPFQRGSNATQVVYEVRQADIPTVRFLEGDLVPVERAVRRMHRTEFQRQRADAKTESFYAALEAYIEREKSAAYARYKENLEAEPAQRLAAARAGLSRHSHSSACTNTLTNHTTGYNALSSGLSTNASGNAICSE